MHNKTEEKDIHISENLFCRITEVLAFSKKEELTEEEELGRQHVLKCIDCRKKMESLIRILQEGDYDSLFDEEGNINPDAPPLLSMNP